MQAVAPVLDVRIVNDKFTGQPRGFAFVHFASIADAARALHAFNVSVLGTACTMRMIHEGWVAAPANLLTGCSYAS